MTKAPETNEMDGKNQMMIFVLLSLFVNQVSGFSLPQPVNLEVTISDGEVMVLWKHPTEAPSDFLYNVQMAKYADTQWANVSSCMRIKKTYCHLSSFIDDYRARYKVRVQLVKGDNKSKWVFLRFLPTNSDLLPPSFTLWATSSTVTVKVHEKPILKKLFLFGVTYVIYLEEIGQENKTTTVYMNDDVGEHQRTKTFTGLHWGRRYCVSIKVEPKGSLYSSSISEQQCLFLPEQEFYIIAASSLSILGVLSVVAIMSSILLCYLRSPAKTPTALKSPLSGWYPLSVSEGAMEAVTDKGWFLSSYRTETKHPVKVPVSHVTVIEDSEEESRRTSMDSGLSMEADSALDHRENPPARQEDSGCGSMAGSESSTDSQTDYPLPDERIDTDQVRKGEDSAVDTMSCQLDPSLNLKSQDRELLMKSVFVGNYRSQSPSVVQIQIGDGEDMLKEIPTHPVLTEVVTGYRAGPQSCICSGAGQCSWCHKYGHFGPEVIKQHTPVCVENILLGGRSDVKDSHRGNVFFAPHAGKTHLDTLTISDLETAFLQGNETFPLLSSLPPAKCEQDFNMNNLSLCDVQLTTD